MIDLSEVSYGEILDCIVDASLGRLSPYFQEYARHEIASLANADGELPHHPPISLSARRETPD